jgi:predicted transcriptional regulator
MGQIAIYLENELQKKMDQRAKREGKSRSAWVKEAIEEKIQSGLPDSWFQVWGSWEDDRSSEAILEDIDSGYKESERPNLK